MQGWPSTREFAPAAKAQTLRLDQPKGQSSVHRYTVTVVDDGN